MGFGIGHQQVKNSSLNEFLKLFNQEGKNDELLEYQPKRSDVLGESSLGKAFDKFDEYFRNIEYIQIENKDDLIDKGLYGFRKPEITYVSYLNHPTIQEFNNFLVESNLTSKELFLMEFSKRFARINKHNNIKAQDLVEKYKEDETVNWSENLDEIKEKRLKRMNEGLHQWSIFNPPEREPYERFKKELEIHYEKLLNFYKFYDKCSTDKNSWILISMG